MKCLGVKDYAIKKQNLKHAMSDKLNAFRVKVKYEK